ncbi:MAG: GTPase ObgE [Verrucomicrobia bacterium GWF2_51_19]|nr:MAG: GTPase ObgE [Verrucomicrobia bacterium GWF2_51_19]HCJ11567.1 GTPase ObgE [Opitutae bacterium]
MFIDEVSVFLKSGNGGDGCMSFRREKYIPKGGPDGGDGGKGGSIILQCSVQWADLTPYRFKPHAEAEVGESGKGRQKHGKDGLDCILMVPAGTIVIDEETGRPVAELLNDGETVVLLKGGKGGKGNIHFKNAINQAPRQTTSGELHEEGHFRFVMKTIADIGLVGFPNAGKSSLIGAITHAHPKTASYPFTTLHPNIGVLEYADGQRLLMADIPGLIQGASENRGLGHRFLKHIERCTTLIFLIDMAAEDGRKPEDDYTQLRKELELYNQLLLEKKQVVVANKMDMPDSAEHLKRFQKKHGIRPISISCLEGSGLEELKTALKRA